MRRREFIKLGAGLSAAALLPRTGWAAPTHIVVVGGGIVGASIAYHLVRHGARVTLCEKLEPASGATGKSFAWINSTFSKQPRNYFDLNALGVAGWRRLDKDFAGDLQIQWGGCMEWYPAGAEADALRKDVARAQTWGHAVHLVDEEELHRLLPGVTPGPMAAASFSEFEGTIDPVYTTKTLVNKLKQFGVRVLYPCEITGMVRAGDRVRAVETTQGRLELETLVLAAGVGTPRLAAMVDVHVPMKDSPGVLAHTAPTARLLERVALAPGANMKQNPDGRVVTGLNFSESPASSANREFGEEQLRRATAFLPRLKEAKLEYMTLGWRVMPQDEYPIIGLLDRCPNVYIAAMHSGVSLAPIVGQFATAEILDGVRVEMLAPYRLSRFA